MADRQQPSGRAQHLVPHEDQGDGSAQQDRAPSLGRGLPQQCRAQRHADAQLGGCGAHIREAHVRVDLARYQMDYGFEYVNVEDPRNNSLSSTSPNRPTSRSPTPRTCADRFNTISCHLLRFLRSLEREYVRYFTLAGVPQTTTSTDFFVQDLPRAENLTIATMVFL